MLRASKDSALFFFKGEMKLSIKSNVEVLTVMAISQLRTSETDSHSGASSAPGAGAVYDII